MKKGKRKTLELEVKKAELGALKRNMLLRESEIGKKRGELRLKEEELRSFIKEEELELDRLKEELRSMISKEEKKLRISEAELEKERKEAEIRQADLMTILAVEETIIHKAVKDEEIIKREAEMRKKELELERREGEIRSLKEEELRKREEKIQRKEAELQKKKGVENLKKKPSRKPPKSQKPKKDMRRIVAKPRDIKKDVHGTGGMVHGGARIEKTMDRTGDAVFVYLTVKNDQNKLMRNVQVIDRLPEDAQDVEVLTSEMLFEHSPGTLAWKISSLNKGEKRVFHYKMNSESDTLPVATSRWVGEKPGGWTDLNELATRIGDSGGKQN